MRLFWVLPASAEDVSCLNLIPAQNTVAAWCPVPVECVGTDMDRPLKWAIDIADGNKSERDRQAESNNRREMQHNVFTTNQAGRSDRDPSAHDQGRPSGGRHLGLALQKTNAAMFGHATEFKHSLTRAGLLRQIFRRSVRCARPHFHNVLLTGVTVADCARWGAISSQKSKLFRVLHMRP